MYAFKSYTYGMIGLMEAGRRFLLPPEGEVGRRRFIGAYTK